MGTAAYMSPEQAEGKEAGPRSDIFSFGALLYEMVSGQLAFRGDTQMSTLSAVLRDDPKPVTDLRGDTPGELARIIARCLRKDPARRFQHMDDLKVALEELKEESESGKLLTSHGCNAAQPARSARRYFIGAGIAGALCPVGPGRLVFHLPHDTRDRAARRPAHQLSGLSVSRQVSRPTAIRWRSAGMEKSTTISMFILS